MREQVRSIALTTLLALVGACGGGAGPEAEIRAWLDEVESAAERGEFGTLVQYVDEAYRDARGNDRAGLTRELRRLGLGAGQRELVVDVETLEVFANDAARVDLTFLYASLPGDRLRLDAGRYAVSLELVRSGSGVWTVISSRWGRAGEALR